VYRIRAHNGTEQADRSGNREVDAQCEEAGIEAKEWIAFAQHQKLDRGDAGDHSGEDARHRHSSSIQASRTSPFRVRSAERGTRVHSILPKDGSRPF
jgi:hypothetical protein